MEDQMDYECIICGKYPEDCLCPVCTECETQGDPDCIKNHMEVSSWRESLRHAQTLILSHPEMQSYLSRKVLMLLHTGGMVFDDE